VNSDLFGGALAHRGAQAPAWPASNSRPCVTCASSEPRPGGARCSRARHLHTRCSCTCFGRPGSNRSLSRCSCLIPHEVTEERSASTKIKADAGLRGPFRACASRMTQQPIEATVFPPTRQRSAGEPGLVIDGRTNARRWKTHSRSRPCCQPNLRGRALGGRGPGATPARTLFRGAWRSRGKSRARGTGVQLARAADAHARSRDHLLPVRHQHTGRAARDRKT